jgi:hypothetical protein
MKFSTVPIGRYHNFALSFRPRSHTVVLHLAASSKGGDQAIGWGFR